LFLKTRKINLELDLSVFIYPSFLLMVLSGRSTQENYFTIIIIIIVNPAEKSIVPLPQTPR
jgi:hypothetical protein